MDKRLFAVIIAVMIILAIVLYLFPQAIGYVFPLIAGVIAILIVLRMSRSASEAGLRLALVLPLLIGITVSLMTGRFLFAVLGAAIPAAIVVWPVLRAREQIPSHLQPVLKELQAGNLDQALLLVNQSIQAHPDIWQAYQLRSVIHQSRMQVLEAERDARTALKLKPDSFYNHNALSQPLMIQGRYREAKEEIIEAMRLAPKQVVNHYNLGIVCYRLGEYAALTEALTKAIQAELLTSQKLWAHYLLGRSLEALGQQDRAEQTYRAMKR